MSKTAITKGLNTYKSTRKVVSVPAPRIPLPLDTPMKEQRLPTKDEMLDEVVALSATMLVGLRGSDNIYRASSALQSIMKTIKDVYLIKSIDEIAPEVIQGMSDEELKEYLQKQLELIK
jgi:hypothetical protein